mgnify:CR=1 FL=1
MSPRDDATLCARVIRVAVDATRDPYVVRETWRVARGARDARELVTRIVRHVLAVPYQPDGPGSDPIQSVAETLRGVPCDCEDRAAAVLAMLAVCGLDGGAVYVAVEGAPVDHMASCARVGGRYVWADATPPGIIGGTVT